MKSLAHSFLLCFAVAPLLTLAAVPDPSLTGCWRAVKIVQFFKGGGRNEDSSGRCTLQFQDDQLESTCATSSGPVTSTYRYRIDRPTFYLATMTGSTYRTTLIGSTREYEYRVAGDRLTTATNLPVAEPATPTTAVRVSTEAERAGCPQGAASRTDAAK